MRHCRRSRGRLIGIGVAFLGAIFAQFPDTVLASEAIVFALAFSTEGDLTFLGSKPGGGVAAADEQCNEDWDLLNPYDPRTFVAWLSTTSMDAVDRLTPDSGPFLLPSGTKIADSVADLTDGLLDAPINESIGIPWTARVWTATLANGRYVGTGDCQGWTSASGSEFAGYGDTDLSGAGWSWSSSGECWNSFSIYCFEVPPPGVCGDGDVSVFEECDDGNTDDGDCCSSTCTIEPAGTVCRAIGEGYHDGDCDIEETCDGTSATCPLDDFLPDGPACDDGYACTGAGVCLSGGCSSGSALPNGTVCRAATGPCDAEEVCNGVSLSCPGDLPSPDGTPCDDGNLCSGTDTCDGAGACVGDGKPTGCLSAFEKGVLLIKENKTGKEKLLAKFIKGPAATQPDFGDPMSVGGTNYSVCVFDESDVLAGQINVDRAGDTCAGKSCWKAIGGDPPDGKGFLYKDKDVSQDGVKLLLMKGGDAGKSKLLVKGANNSSKGQSSLPLGIAAGVSGSASVAVQVHSSDGGQCYEMLVTDVKKDTGDFFKAKK